jgi:hypothetical protein
MPLAEKVVFTTTLECLGKVQVPKVVRWRFKMENNQALKIGINFLELHKGWQFFYAKMRKDGRISIPKLALSFFEDEKTSLAGNSLEVMIEPA